MRHYGESEFVAAIWPIGIDGLMIVATLSLVEVVRKVRQLEETIELESELYAVPLAPPAAAPVSPPVWLPPRTERLRTASRLDALNR